MTDRSEPNDNELPHDRVEPDLPEVGDLPPVDGPDPTPPAPAEMEIPPPPSPPGPETAADTGATPPDTPGEPVFPGPGAAAGTPPPATPPPSTAPPAGVPPQQAAAPGAGAPPGAAAAAAGGAGAAPGWYPAPGGQRYWDGQQWTEHAVAGPANPASEYSTAMWAHLSALLISFVACGLGFIGPLVIMNGQGKRSAFIRHHAVEALNFSLTVLIAYIVSAVLMIVIIGFFLLPVIAIGSSVLQIMASIAANRGEWYRYPVSIRFVK